MCKRGLRARAPDSYPFSARWHSKRHSMSPRTLAMETRQIGTCQPLYRCVVMTTTSLDRGAIAGWISALCEPSTRMAPLAVFGDKIAKSHVASVLLVGESAVPHGPA